MQTAKAKVVDNNNREKWPCSHCTAVLCRKSPLCRHEILTHKWDPRTNTTASDEVIEQMKPKKVSKDIVAAALTAAGIGLELSDDESEDASVAASQHPAPDEIIISDVEPETSWTTLTQPSVTVTEAPDPTAKMPGYNTDRSDNKVDVITTNFAVYTMDEELYDTLPSTLPITADVHIVKEHIISKQLFVR